MEILSISILALILSFNVGANNAGASMATAYGSNTLSKIGSVSFIFVFVFLGATFGGEKVIQTVGKEIISINLAEVDIKFTFLILILPILSIAIANILKIPIATTHIVVCTIIGIGLALNYLNSYKVTQIIIWWIVTPVSLWLINYLIGKYWYLKIVNFLASYPGEETVNRILKYLLISSGCFLAFFAGANNAANAAAPIVARDLVSAADGALIAGFFMALGALIFGGRILETVAKGITDICLIRAISVHLTGGLFLAVASFYGIPISLAETVTAGLIGFSCASTGFSRTLKNTSVSIILKFWIFAPLSCIVISYIIAKYFLQV